MSFIDSISSLDGCCCLATTRLYSHHLLCSIDRHIDCMVVLSISSSNRVLHECCKLLLSANAICSNLTLSMSCAIACVDRFSTSRSRFDLPQVMQLLFIFSLHIFFLVCLDYACL